MAITTKWGINLKTKLKFCIYAYMKNENICFEYYCKEKPKKEAEEYCASHERLLEKYGQILA